MFCKETYPPNDGGLLAGKAAPPKAGCVLPLFANVPKEGPVFASTPKVGTLLAAAKAPNPKEIKAIKHLLARSYFWA